MIKTKHLELKIKNGEEPGKHMAEPYIPDFTRFSNKGYAEAKEEPFVLKKRPKLYPVSWGWNADGRAGNATAVELRTPHIAHKSAMRNYITGDAGAHHSLLVSDMGIVYSFGNGRKGQLGYSNEFMVQENAKGPKGGVQQTCPRRVTPSGNLLFGQDIKIAQVAAGRFFSVARQMGPEEGQACVEGLAESVQALDELRQFFPESDDLSKSWAEVRNEKFKVLRISTGQLLTWGTGKVGELGQTMYTTYEPKPKIIKRLSNTCIIKISAGRHHVLAISDTYQLYSWGSGRSGKLGHNSFLDYHEPEYVQFFDKYYVEDCSAGDNHSVVLTRTRKGDRDSQLRRIASFGKGAHGRLGYGRNLVQSLPMLVDTWPPSLQGMQIHQVSAGGAHTMALLYKSVPKSLANPWGRETAVAAWGYGYNGQLGNGSMKDSFVPIKCRMPERCLLIREVCAGRSWSMARSIGGELFTWGKGLRGQLGQGKPKYLLVPTFMKTFASFVHLSADFSHSVCITTAKKVYSRKLSQQAVNYPDPFDTHVEMSLERRDSESVNKFDCCRRSLNPIRRRMRFMCKECNIDCICYDCMKLCHVGHTITERIPIEKQQQRQRAIANTKKRIPRIKPDTELQKQRKLQRKIQKANKNKKKRKKRVKKVELIAIKTKITTKDYKGNLRRLNKTLIPFCRCGVFNNCCQLIPSIPEEEVELCDDEGDPMAVERTKVALNSLSSVVQREQAAIRIQRQAQWYMGRRNIRKIRQNLTDIRRVVANNHFNQKILGPIWEKLDRAKSKFREAREREEMETEEDSKKSYDYFYAMQIGVAACNALKYAGERYVGGLTVQVPRVMNGGVAEKPEYILASSAFSVTSIRYGQLQLHPTKRVSPALLAELARNLPRESIREGVFPDLDLACFTSRFVKDLQTEQWRVEVKKGIQRQVEVREKAIAAARAILVQQKFAAQRAVDEARSRSGPKPPQIPPSPSIIAAQRLAAQQEKLDKLEAEIEMALKVNREDFNMYKTPKEDHGRVRKRNSLGCSENMYKRLLKLQEAVPMQCSSRRRNSLPTKIETITSEEKPNYPAFAESKASLDLFRVRHKMMEEWVSPDFAHLWKNMDDRVKNKRLKRLFGASWLNPRLPMEMRRMLQGSTRRRTIADPERLADQLHILFGIRNLFAQGRAKAAEVDKLRFRRRSFDLGEIKDEDDGILKVLGYAFEEVFKQPTLSELRRDAGLMENRMIFAGVIKAAKDNKKARPDFGGFAAKETVQQRIERELKEKDEQAGKEKELSGGGESRMEQAKAAAGNMPKIGMRNKGGGGGGGGKRAAPKKVAESIIWYEYFSDAGETYYSNPETGESVWEYPTGDAQVLSQYQDDDGNYYWYNWTSGETSWA